MVTKRELLQIALYAIVAFVGLLAVYVLFIYFVVWTQGLL